MKPVRNKPQDGIENKHGDVYQITGGDFDDFVFLKFYDTESEKWLYALDICLIDGIHGIRPRRFKKVDALILAYQIKFDDFQYKHVYLVKKIVKIKNAK